MANSSHFSGPINVGPVSPAGEPSAQGTLQLVQEYTMDITEVTSVEAFRLPADSSLLGMDVVVTTASDAGTTGTVKLSNAAGDIITGFDVTATGLLSAQANDATFADLGRFLDPVSGSTGNLTLDYEETGGAATEGVFTIRVFYTQGSDAV